MVKIDLACEPPRLQHTQPVTEPEAKPHDGVRQRKAETGSTSKPEWPGGEPEQSRRRPQVLSATPRPLSEYLTRRQAAQYVNDELGRPMSFSTASKLAALGEFAPTALWWGRRPLYKRDDLRAWAEARSRTRAKNTKDLTETSPSRKANHP